MLKHRCSSYPINLLTVLVSYCLLLLYPPDLESNIPLTEAVAIKVYSFNPVQISRLERAQSEPLVSTVEVIDLSVIFEIGTELTSLLDYSLLLESDLTDDDLGRLKSYSQLIPHSKIKSLAEAQLLLFDLEARYGVRDSQLPVIIFEQKESQYLYFGKDVYEGFLAWLRLENQSN